ncbi:MAG: TetR/AcrR family transcriptional regulator [Caldilineaceae bacterium]
MNDIPDNETRQRILDAAEELFSKRGYQSVTLRDIAEVVGMRHASLYYYAPKGKEGLFIEVMERMLQRHNAGMKHVLNQAGNDIGDQLRAVAHWFIHQPPMNLDRIFNSDMAMIDSVQAKRLSGMAMHMLTEPLYSALGQARGTGQIANTETGVAAMSLISLVQGVNSIPEGDWIDLTKREEIAQQAVELLLYGLLKR